MKKCPQCGSTRFVGIDKIKKICKKCGYTNDHTKKMTMTIPMGT